MATIVIGLSDRFLAAGRISEPLLTIDQFTALILMAFITTLMAPIALKWSVQRTCLPEEKAAFCSLVGRNGPET